MKLVFLSHSSEPIGGGEKCLSNLIKGIKAIHPGWELYLITPSSGTDRLADECSKYLSGRKRISARSWAIEKSRKNLFRRISYIVRLISKSAILISYMKKIRPDYCMTNTSVVPYLALSSKIMGIPHCWFIHEILALTWRNQCFIFGDDNTYRFIGKFSSTILVPSDYTRKFYIGKNISPDKIKVIRQAVEIPQHDNDVARTDKRYTVMSVGVYDSNKGHLDLLKAVNILTDEGIDIHCIIIGYDPETGYKDILDRYVKEKNLASHIELRDFTDDIFPVYKKTDVVVSCSRMETFGRTIAEARICGLPVIAAKAGAIPEQVNDGIDGLLFEPGDIAGLAQRLKECSNAEYRKRLSDNIPADLKARFSKERFASEFCRLTKTEKEHENLQ